jgi:hypothetical protein
MTVQGKEITLGRALLGLNGGLGLGAALIYVGGTSRTIIFEAIGLAFVILNAYLLVASKVWGKKPNAN